MTMSRLCLYADVITEELSSKERHLEASQILVDYAEDASQAVAVLASGGHFSEAKRLVFSCSFSCALNLT